MVKLQNVSNILDNIEGNIKIMNKYVTYFLLISYLTKKKNLLHLKKKSRKNICYLPKEDPLHLPGKILIDLLFFFSETRKHDKSKVL